MSAIDATVGERAFSMSIQIRPTASGQGSNSTASRHFNERRLLTVLRRLGEASKPDLARHLDLTQNTIGQIVQALEEQGLVASTGRRMGQRGQPATMLHLDPKGAYSLGFKLGCRSIDAMLIDFTGVVLKRRRYGCISPNPDEALRLGILGFNELTRTLLPACRNRLVGVGLALPLTFDRQSDEVGTAAPAQRVWEDYDFVGKLQARLDVPLIQETDGAAAALAELLCGHGRKFNNFIYVHIGSSISGGIVLDGDYRSGVGVNSGGIESIPVPHTSLTSTVKNRGGDTVLFERASGVALTRHLHARGVSMVNAVDLQNVMHSHATIVQEWLQDCAEALVVPLLSIMSLIRVQAIVLDGDLPRALIEGLLARMGSLFRAATPERVSSIELRHGASGNHPAALGAALLPLYDRHSRGNLAVSTLHQS